jgi:SAM-dependent methyltransferase
VADSLREVKGFWEANSCGEALYLQGADYAGQSKKRYALEPFIESFAKFSEVSGKKVLEIGLGLGADHQRFAEGGASLFGLDLTARSVAHVLGRFRASRLTPRLLVGDGQRLPYLANTFDVVYSWGVVHHAPTPATVIHEALRVLKPAGCLKIMIYHKWSMVGFMLWVRYGLLRFRPFTSLATLYSRYLESPGTKAYSVREARELLAGCERVEISTTLTHGDLLSSEAGQRHQGILLKVARIVWPRWILAKLFPRLGLFMMITAWKPDIGGP